MEMCTVTRQGRDGRWFTGHWEQLALQRPGYVTKKWLKAFRMDKASFMWLVQNHCGGPFEASDTNWRFAIPKEKRVAIVLYFLAHGQDYISIADKFDVSYQFVWKLCKVLLFYLLS